jgi:pyruvate/2-oxoglutarate dehydrogenase complex dihydrolipoamide acyltransferase (E2) component
MADIIVGKDLWEEHQTAVISSWLYRNGETVAAGSVVAEVMVEKASFDLQAPVSGVLTILVKEEEPLGKGMTVGRID